MLNVGCFIGRSSGNERRQGCSDCSPGSGRPGCVIRTGGFLGNAVKALPCTRRASPSIFSGDDGQAEFLLECAGEGTTAYRCAPAARHLALICAMGASGRWHLDFQRLLAMLATALGCAGLGDPVANHSGSGDYITQFRIVGQGSVATQVATVGGKDIFSCAAPLMIAMAAGVQSTPLACCSIQPALGRGWRSS